MPQKRTHIRTNGWKKTITYIKILQIKVFVIDAAFSSRSVDGVEIDGGIIVGIKVDFDDAVSGLRIGAEIDGNDAGFVTNHHHHFHGG